jgi:multiple sugar transport system ATP-binding protein
MTTLELRNVVKKFKDNVVLDDVSLRVEDGETLVLFGPSGAGKTVLLRLVAGVVDPDAGDILIGGRSMKDVEPEDRGVGMAFQNFALFPHMTAFDNIASPLEASNSASDKIKAGVESVAKLLKIGHVLSHHPRALSNGQKQRTALAAPWPVPLHCCSLTTRCATSMPSCALKCASNCRASWKRRARRWSM